jgi:hypothetical protein
MQPAKKRRPLPALVTSAIAFLLAGGLLIGILLWRGNTPVAPAKTGLRILSVPPNAHVKLDGKLLAQPTPVQVPEMDREHAHELELSLPGYQSKRQTITSEEEVLVVLPADVGSIDVRSEPAGAEIYLNGRPSGQTTPATLQNVPFGREVTLELRLRGYRVHRETLLWNGKRQLTVPRIVLRRSD